MQHFKYEKGEAKSIMLQNPSDYKFTKYKQSRGDGDSGQIHIGRPLRENLCTILVKDYKVSDAINEFIGCNIGQRIGVNTPQAWLFDPDKSFSRSRIRFDRAVCIEYLDGMDESIGGSYDTEELARQTIQGNLLHCLMKEEDQYSLARYKEKVYAFDFATSLYLEAGMKGLPPAFTSIKMPNGLTVSDDLALRTESRIRKNIARYINSLEDKGTLNCFITFI